MGNKKVRAVFVLALVMFSSIAFAAASTDIAQQSSPASVVYALLFNGGAFIATVIWLQKKYMNKVDDLAKTTPELVETLKTIAKSLCKHDVSIKEHYEELEAHGKKLTKIDTIHRVKGCDAGAKDE